MSKRVTIMIDDDLNEKIRLLQAKLIAKSVKSVKYSRVLNDVLRKNLKWIEKGRINFEKYAYTVLMHNLRNLTKDNETILAKNTREILWSYKPVKSTSNYNYKIVLHTELYMLYYCNS